MAAIIMFDSTQLPTLEQAGGKALALMEMTRAGMPVPPGFVLTEDYFKPWFDTLKRSPHWMTLRTASAKDIGQTAKAIQELCRALTFTAEQKDVLEQALTSFRKTNHVHLYTVRSSSPEEDLEGASFAGGYETTLGVTLDGIEAAIRHSFKSGFDEHVFLYKREHGFQINEPRIAVIVQQQVDADSAGAAFSLNPLNNCYDEAVINAKGIILEIGGALQHGAVVAREYGTPCVSGVDDATELLKDGQLVEVDGSNGIILVIVPDDLML